MIVTPEYDWASGMSARVRHIWDEADRNNDFHARASNTNNPGLDAGDILPLTDLFVQSDLTGIELMDVDTMLSLDWTPDTGIQLPAMSTGSGLLQHPLPSAGQRISSLPSTLTPVPTANKGNNPPPPTGSPLSSNPWDFRFTVGPASSSSTIQPSPRSSTGHISNNPHIRELFGQWTNLIQPFRNRCALCYYNNPDGPRHRWTDKKSSEMRGECDAHPSFGEFLDWKRRWLSPASGMSFEKYSCCYRCFLPYDLCRLINDSANCSGKTGTADIVLPVVLMARVLDDIRPTPLDIPYPMEDNDFSTWLRKGLGIATPLLFARPPLCLFALEGSHTWK
ncbi:hypothetical protein GP486_005738 [Trichoglossum hirsutum]|uniref:Uncharacterized protein n=1 Tax=Trichoglossum hirsutum TaxID=265104 RepID=A0A9P8L8M4_9PEZI|nr:hypothetical protein GP486_005738 [Trichoglossum hirsutum]